MHVLFCFCVFDVSTLLRGEEVDVVMRELDSHSPVIQHAKNLYDDDSCLLTLWSLLLDRGNELGTSSHSCGKLSECITSVHVINDVHNVCMCGSPPFLWVFGLW